MKLPRVLPLLSSVLFLASCGGGVGSRNNQTSAPPGVAPLQVTSQNIQGAWELSSINHDGVASPAAVNQQSSARAAGYKESVSRVQYQITDKKLRLIESDELAVNSVFELDYKLEGSKVVTQNTPNLKLAGFQVLSMTATTMTVRSDSDPKNQTLTYHRINDHDLATVKLKPVPQQMESHLTTAAGDVHDAFQANYAASASAKPQARTLSCYYKQGAHPTLTLTTYNNSFEGGKVTTSPDLSFSAPIQFNWAKSTEELTTQVTSASELFGRYSAKDGRVNRYALKSPYQCNVHIKRAQRHLEVFTVCPEVSVFEGTSDKGQRAALTVMENCALSF